MAIADALCAVPRRPAQLADLLRLLTEYAHEVPAEDPAVPEHVQRLAEARGSSQAHEAARALLSARRRAAQA
jgi:hypothetical protein